MSGTSTPSNQERDAQLLSIGQQCSEDHCHLVDFLPFKCEHCKQAFCGEHFHPQAHKCDKYDESQHNRIAPPCEYPVFLFNDCFPGSNTLNNVGPFCSTPIAVPPGEDPNIRMERHFNNDCSVLSEMSGQSGSGKKSSAPHCARAKCNKVLWAPIRCDVSVFLLDAYNHAEPVIL